MSEISNLHFDVIYLFDFVSFLFFFLDCLFDLLLDISSTNLSSADQAQSSYSSTLTSFACACLLSLVIASGDTGKLLCAASAMLMSSQLLALEEIPV